MTFKWMLSALVRFLEVIADLFVVTVLWLLCSIPLITIGTASAAMYYTVVKAVRKEHNGLIRTFFQSFKQNFQQSIGVTLLFLLGCGLLGAYVLLGMYSISPTSGFYVAYWAVVAVLSVVFFTTVLYVFSLLSRFSQRTFTLVKNGFLLSAAHSVKSFGLLCLLALTVYLLLCLPIGILFLPGFYTFLSSLVLEPIFRKYTPAGEPQGEEVPWYNDK